MRRPLIAGNWKMNLSKMAAVDLAACVARQTERFSQVDVVLCPPSVYLDAVATAVCGWRAAVGAQNVFYKQQGAYTGEISVRMLVDLACRYAIVGHSERRATLGESDELIALKVQAVVEGGLVPIVCIGETKIQRDAGQTLTVIHGQVERALDKLAAERRRQVVIAYEPVWAIGNPPAPEPVVAETAAESLRTFLSGKYGSSTAAAVRILYGGAVQPDNVAGFLAQTNVDGVLVGGASLTAESFIPMVEAAESAKANGSN